ncbi:MAG: hypothetical protein AAF502_21065 [Bacteroidota bacterium]
MIKTAAIYRQILATSCLVFYLTCAFQPIILESIHFLTHIGDIVSLNYVSHSVKTHDNHSHDFIDLLEISFDVTACDHNSGNEEEAPNIKLKKIPEVGQKTVLTSNPDENKFFTFFDAPNLYKSVDRDITIPPPKA